MAVVFRKILRFCPNRFFSISVCVYIYTYVVEYISFEKTSSVREELSKRKNVEN